MFKEFMIVGVGSFMGGGCRYLVSRVMAQMMVTTFPLGTFAVNIVGCMLIGLLSAIPVGDSWLSPAGKLLLATGFCGGFTTFSTFINESAMLMDARHWAVLWLYAILSISVGLAAVYAGRYLGLLLR